jgi:serine/threonine protein kinase
MEFLPTNLTSCIEQYSILPKEISYSILHDVALGLCYLHSQTPPIIHRDLSSNNVLLTPNMTAKISDLGAARILNLTPLQVSRTTQTPGTPAFMPPEVMVANPKYDASVDNFSYGIIMIHMFSGQWPEPQVGQTQIEGGKLIPVTEAERREVFLKAIEEIIL